MNNEEEIPSTIDEPFNILVKNNEPPSIPEQLFVNYFLPYLSGKRNIKPDDDIIPQWVSIAGTPMSRVNIKNTEGEIVCSVPGLFNTDILNMNRKDTPSYTSILDEYRLKSNNIPVVADNYLNNELSKSVEGMKKTSSINKEDKSEWDYIMKKYYKEDNQSIDQENQNPDSELDDD